MLRRSKKLIALMVSAVMLSTSSINVFAADDWSNGKLSTQDLETIEKSVEEMLTMQRKLDGAAYREQMGISNEDEEGNEDLTLQDYSPDEQVRVIVELKDAPAKDAKENKIKGNEFKKAHKKAKKNIENKGVKGEYRHDYTIGVNGFSMETEYKNIKEIKDLHEVENVTIAKVYNYEMTSSKSLVNAQEAWKKLDVEGDGMVVAVVDSGVDYLHQDMKLTEKGKEKASLNQEILNEKFALTEVDETYYTDKVPTGYDWADMDNDALPGKSSHGTHVAGIIGANGDEENNGVIGVAPGTQIIVEKVFSDKYNGAYSDDIIAGIQHAVQMGADVINLSLGSPAGTVSEEDNPEQKAIRNAVEQGTMVVAAGGNEYYSTYNYHPYPQARLPFADNPDIGVVGTPGVSPYALQVSSYENDNYRLNKMKLSSGEEFGYKKQSTPDIVDKLGANKEYELVYANRGTAEDLKDLDLTGKIAVVYRDQPHSMYTSIQFDSAKKGAVAVILRGADVQKDYPVINCTPTSIPLVTTGIEDGNKLMERLKNGEKLTMSFSNDGVWVENLQAETMSGFSSWGAPQNLDFKPEISGPGGNIYSTVKDNKYDVYSGTSMAAPHVAAGTALVLESLKDKGEDKSMDTVLKSKIMLMNTSEVLYDKTSTENTPYSPRKQGSGLMKIDKAIETPALVYDRNTTLEKAGAVALKEIKGNKSKFNLTLQALEGETVPKDLSYDVYIDILADEVVTKDYDNNVDGTIDRTVDCLTTKTVRVNGAEAKVNGKRISNDISSTIQVKRGKKAQLNFEIDLSKATNLNENSFVEGFVRFVPKDNENIPELVMPYMGFYGDWTAPKNIDSSIYNSDDNFMGYTVLWDQAQDNPLGYEARTGKFYQERVAVSPRSFNDGPYASFTALRNLEKAEVYVEDQDGNMIKYISDFSQYTGDGEPWKFKKNIMPYQDYSYKMEYDYWDMTDESGNIVSDGDYQFVIKTTLDYENAEPQITKLPIKIDSVAPEVKNIQVTEENGEYRLSWEATDNEGGCGYSGAMLYVDGKLIPNLDIKDSYVLKEEPKGAVIIALDYAGNIRYEVYGEPIINSGMLISTWFVSGAKVNYESPAKIFAYANKKVNWTITIKDFNGNEVDSANIENKDAIYGLAWYPEKGLPDGKYSVTLHAIDENGFEVTTDPKTINVVNNQ